MEDINHRIARRIAARRESLGWTKTKVATLAGISQGFYSKLERNESGFTPDTTQRIAGALGMSLDRLYAADSNVEEVMVNFRTIPLLGYDQASRWRPDQKVDSAMFELIPMHMDTPPSTFALRILGDSMLPRFTAGDDVIIDPTLQPKPGNFVVARENSGAATFRQYRGLGLNEQGKEAFELVPLNPLYPPMRSDRTGLAIIGVMIEHRIYRAT